ncbi:MAG TPA: farnesyl diphosphate synthase [Salinisphaeraceae bacterium]|nr:farnesyl diphosphate synthase [Salinisphaeraceae bacterium]
MPSAVPIDGLLAHAEQALQQRLPAATSELNRAMRYAVLGQGKRIRPLLVYATGTVLDVPLPQLDAPACAAELIHAYSLIHDDLPAMDNDDLRRGQPTVHIAFDEGLAILAGDALQARAFHLLATDPAIGDDAAIRARLVVELAEACGENGMVGGQALDLASEGQPVDLARLEQIHRMKTGALLLACVRMAAACCPNLDADRAAALNAYGQHIGLVFQVRDDILDVTGTTEQLGKHQGADAAHDKATYPALLGLAEAEAYAEQTYQDALAALAPFADRAEPLRVMAHMIARRDN